MIARSPGRSTSSPRGKIASPSRTSARDQRAADRHLLERLPAYSLPGRVVMSSTSKRSPSSIATCCVRGSCAKRTISSAVTWRGSIVTSIPACSKTSTEDRVVDDRDREARRRAASRASPRSGSSCRRAWRRSRPARRRSARARGSRGRGPSRGRCARPGSSFATMRGALERRLDQRARRSPARATRGRSPCRCGRRRR